MGFVWLKNYGLPRVQQKPVAPGRAESHQQIKTSERAPPRKRRKSQLGFLEYPKVKIDGTGAEVPKGRLVKGLWKPICRDCAITVITCSNIQDYYLCLKHVQHVLFFRNALNQLTRFQVVILQICMETILPYFIQATFVTYTHFSPLYMATIFCIWWQFVSMLSDAEKPSGLPIMFLPKVGGSCESARGAKAGVDVTRSLSRLGWISWTFGHGYGHDLNRPTLRDDLKFLFPLGSHISLISSGRFWDGIDERRLLIFFLGGGWNVSKPYAVEPFEIGSMDSRWQCEFFWPSRFCRCRWELWKIKWIIMVQYDDEKCFPKMFESTTDVWFC